MKEWCLKHPFLTFIIVYDTMIAVTNVIANMNRDTILDVAEDGITAASRAIKEASVKEDEDRVIGFRV